MTYSQNFIEQNLYEMKTGRLTMAFWKNKETIHFSRSKISFNKNFIYNIF